MTIRTLRLVAFPILLLLTAACQSNPSGLTQTFHGELPIDGKIIFK
jgi:hypothetical protein